VAAPKGREVADQQFRHPGSIRIRSSGTAKEPGSKWATEQYPFQGLDIPTDGYATDAETRRSLQAKYPGNFTPFGTSQVIIARGADLYEDYLHSPCGYCSRKMATCTCGTESI
jgi:hypothetical protein